MRFAPSLTGIVWLLLAEGSAGFLSHGRVGERAKTYRFAGANDLPDIVKAYQNTKAVNSFQDLSLSLPLKAPLDAAPVVVVPPVVPPVVIPDLTPVVIPDSTPSMVDEFLNAAKETYQSTSSSVIESTKSMAASPHATGDNVGAVKEWAGWHHSILGRAPVPSGPGRAPTLANFLTGQPASPGVDHAPVDMLANAREKIEMMIDNTFSLFGQAKPAVKLPQISFDGVNLEGIQAATASSIGPFQGQAGWIAAGFALLVAANQRNVGISEARREMEVLIKKEAEAVKELADDLKSMNSEIVKLNGETKELQKKLKTTAQKLIEKDLEISRERLKVMDKELQMNREVKKIASKATSSEAKSAKLESQLLETIKVKEALMAASDKVKEMENDLMGAARKKTSPEPKLMVVKEPVPVFVPEPKYEPMLEVNGVIEKVAVRKAPPQAKPVATKVTAKVATKRVPVKKEAKPEAAAAAAPKVAKATSEDLTILKAPVKKEAKKAAAPVAKKAAAPAAEATSEDWKIFSDSTLTRKTVVDLQAYLEAKGVTTVDKAGKPMKKALLVEAVRSN